MRKKLAFVVQRYGLEVNGGAELHCRQLVEHLMSKYDVEVITTKAVDYVTWNNEYVNDVDIINGVTVRRFSVDRTRDNASFEKINAKVLTGRHTDADEMLWADEQGPLSTELIDYIFRHEGDYDVFVFMTYLYYTTLKGLPKVAHKAILIPTAHDEPPIYLNCYKKIFTTPKGIFYNTEEEKAFVEKRFRNSHILNNMGAGGVGIELPSHIDSFSFKKSQGINNYMVYVGRIDESKGCKTLFEYFIYYKEHNDNNLKLVLMGKPVMSIPKHKDIINVGFVADDKKFDIMAGAVLGIIPSSFESLSMVLLESMSLSVPVVVNGKCEVLKGHCVKSNAGLYYESYREFEGCIDYMLCHKEEREAMGKNGKKYVEENYQWDVIVDRFADMVERVIGSHRVFERALDN